MLSICGFAKRREATRRRNSLPPIRDQAIRRPNSAARATASNPSLRQNRRLALLHRDVRATIMRGILVRRANDALARNNFLEAVSNPTREATARKKRRE